MWKTRCRARITNSEELIEARHFEHRLEPNTLKMEKKKEKEKMITMGVPYRLQLRYDMMVVNDDNNRIINLHMILDAPPNDGCVQQVSP